MGQQQMQSVHVVIPVVPHAAYAGTERVRVYMRIRPPVRIEETPGALAWKHHDRNSGPPEEQHRPSDLVTLYRPDSPVPQSDFSFDRVLGPSLSQQDVYTAAVKDVVRKMPCAWGSWHMRLHTRHHLHLHPSLA